MSENFSLATDHIHAVPFEYCNEIRTFLNLGPGPEGYDGAAQRIKFRESARYPCYGQVRVDCNEDREAGWQAQSVQVPDQESRAR